MNGGKEKSRGRQLLKKLGFKKDDWDGGPFQQLIIDTAVNPQHFLALPLKETIDGDIRKYFRKFFDNHSSNLCVKDSDITSAIEEINNLRAEACVRPLQDLEQRLYFITQYYDQLVAFENKLLTSTFPIFDEIRWQDAFGRGKSFLGKFYTEGSNLDLEKASMLYNYGAVLSHMAVSKPLYSDADKQLAAKIFQQSAGGFAKLTFFLRKASLKFATIDMQSDIVGILAQMMLAQAQECVYLKGYEDKMNHKALAKIAAKIGDIYCEVNGIVAMEPMKNYWPKGWPNITTGKYKGFYAISEFHQAQVNLERQQISERMTRLQRSFELVQEAKRYLPEDCLQKQFTEIESEYTTATKENKLIYQARLLDYKSLPSIPRAMLVKPVQPDKRSPISSEFKDIFSSIIPTKTVLSLENYQSMKHKELKKEAERLKENTEIMEGIMASLGVESSALSDSLKQHSADVRKQGGLKELQHQINEMSSLVSRNREICVDIEKSLNEEKLSDADLRNRLGAKYGRISSEKLTGPLLQELSNYRSNLNSKGCEAMKKKFDENRKAIEMLEKSEKELLSLLPVRPHRMADKSPEAMSFLMKLLDKSQEIKCERVDILKDITTECNATAVNALSTLNESKLQNPGDEVEVKLSDDCELIKQEVNRSIRKQEALMRDVDKWSARFSPPEGPETPSERDHADELLEHGYEVFCELNKKLPDKIKHYHDLMDNLLRLQSKVNDYSFARETEKEELLRQHAFPCSGFGAVPAIPTHLTTAQVSFVPVTTPSYPSQGLLNGTLPSSTLPTTIPPFPTTGNYPQHIQPTTLQPQSTHYNQMVMTPPPPYQPTYPNLQTGPSPWHGMSYPH